MTEHHLYKLLRAQKPIIFDGAMGTVLFQKGYGRILAEELNIQQPFIISEIHREYIEAGADIIETNTFNAGFLKLQELNLVNKLEQINQAAVANARKAIATAATKRKVLVAGSLGPTGKLMEPIGSLSFEDAYNNYKKQAEVLYKAGVDLFIVETVSDIQESRAALIAIKDVCALPVICSMTYNQDGRTLTGTDLYTAAVTLHGLGAAVVSLNCSIGPDGVLDIFKNYHEKLKTIPVPYMVMPNAGLPVIENNQAIYKMKPAEFADIMNEFRKYGVSIYGGCCGTSPAHIQAMTEKIKTKLIKLPKKYPEEVYFTSRSKVVKLSAAEPFLKIGETLNPTARKHFAEELRSGKDVFLRTQAKEQTAAGADLLDINVGIAQIDTKQAMKKSIQTLTTIVETPLCLDSDDPAVLEVGLKNYPGLALINSVNGKRSSLDKIVPLALRYGAGLIALALDEHGIPGKAADRLKIVEKIVKYLEEKNFPISKLFIDGLVLSAASNPEAPVETIKIIKNLTAKKIKTSLGVSNVSFGLPERKYINNVFLDLLKKVGLSAGIINVSTFKQLKKYSPAELKAKAVLLGEDPSAKEYINFCNKLDNKPTAAKPTQQLTGLEAIKAAVIAGEEENILDLVNTELTKNQPEQILENGLLPALTIVGEYYSSGKYYLPQMIASANTMKKAFVYLKTKMPHGALNKKGTAIICTVEGDIHDIGKNIVGMLLENNGYQIIDLGKDVPATKIIEAVKTHKADLVLLSALLTTTMIKMKEVKQQLLAEGINIPVMVGGAVVTADYAKEIGANYSTDAADAVQVIAKLLKKN